MGCRADIFESGGGPAIWTLPPNRACAVFNNRFKDRRFEGRKGVASLLEEEKGSRLCLTLACLKFPLAECLPKC
jgi:hypothetical protein